MIKFYKYDVSNKLLINLLNKLNQDIDIVIKKRPISRSKKQDTGHVHVLYA